MDSSDSADGTDRRQHERDSGEYHAEEHHHHDVETVALAVVTVSSSRTLDDDPSGDAVAAAASADERATIADRVLVDDDRDSIAETIGTLVARNDVDAVVTTGGTGVTPDDVTVEAAETLFDKRLPGFGELFRRLSEAEIGTRTVATRATAGIVDRAPVFCLPGSENAATLGTEEIVLPEAGHLVGLADR